MIASGTDQTWVLRPGFGVYGDGVLMRGCVANVRCGELYMDALRQLAGSSAIAALPGEARTIRAVIAPWRVRDPRREQTVAEGEAAAEVKIGTMEGRPAELAEWLASPWFVDAAQPAEPEIGGDIGGEGGGGGGGGGGDFGGPPSDDDIPF
jgi:hypothetical protein